MKFRPFIFVAIVLGIMSPVMGADPVQGEGIQTSGPDMDKQRKEYFSQLNKMYQSVPTAIKLEKGINDMIALLLTVEGTADAGKAAVKIKKMDQDSKALQKPLQDELMLYSKDGNTSRMDLGLRTFTNRMKTLMAWTQEIVESTRGRGAMTKELSDALNLNNFTPVAPCPAMSAELDAFWKKEFSTVSRLNRALFSLQDRKDIPRVSEELKGVLKAKAEQKLAREKLYPLKSESDKAGEAETVRRFKNGPVRALSVVSAVLSNRGFVNTKDPDLQEIQKLILEVLR